MRFSERIQGESSEPALQVGMMDQALRNSIWNLLLELYHKKGSHHYWARVWRYLGEFFFKFPLDELPSDDDGARQSFKNVFFELPWNAVYDLLEFVVEHHEQMASIDTGYSSVVSWGGIIRHPVSSNEIVKKANRVLERERSGYRFVRGVLIPIADPLEIEEIERAASRAQSAGFAGALEHIRASVEMMGRKPDPDYRNAIKEAISAVESVAKVLSGARTGTLDSALDRLAGKVSIHPAMKAGFSNLYGFTSDEGGIRHAMLDQSNVGFAEAKYMLIACSAFVNLLIAKAEEAGLIE